MQHSETKAGIFMKGKFQAVLLPKEFRFRGKEVKIRREGTKVILESLEHTQWPSGFWDMFTPDPDFEIPPQLPSTPFDL